MRLRALAFVAVVGALPHAFGQSVISTRAGLINFSEGLVYVDGHPLAKKYGAYERLKNGATLVTESGRAEVLLTPNTYLRIGENSSIRMVSDDLSDPRVEILAGSAALDSQSASPTSCIELTFRDTTIRVIKPGRYRIDADPPRLRVFDGEAEVVKDGKPVQLESAQLMPLDGAPIVKRFTEGADGLLDLWSDERHSLIASNLSNSKSIYDPLVDPGPDATADYLSSLGAYGAYGGPSGAYGSYGAYGGYIPLAGLPTVMGGYYTYDPYGYNPYSYSFLQPYGLVVIRPTYSRVLTTYGSRTGTTSTIFGSRPTTGIINVPRPVVYTPRPAAPAVHVGVRPVGHR